MRKARNTIFFLFCCFVFLVIDTHAAWGEEKEPLRLKVLTANIGNADFQNCGSDYFFKLCLSEWEKPIRKSMDEINPDIVALQEVYDIQWCEKKPPEKNKKKVCYKYAEREEIHQARRLLGPEYTIVCDGRSNFECLGVKKTVGEIEGCPAGEICREKTDLTIPAAEGCDEKSVIFGVNLKTAAGVFRIIDGHPLASNEKCRAEEVRRMFEGYDGSKPLADTGLRVLAMGDMNLDPFVDDPASPDIAAWHKHVGDGKSFYYLSGPAEKDPPYPTVMGKTIDHVISNFAAGKCRTLGEAPDTERLDGVATKAARLEANDHRAILCEIEFPVSE